MSQNSSLLELHVNITSKLHTGNMIESKRRLAAAIGAWRGVGGVGGGGLAGGLGERQGAAQQKIGDPRGGWVAQRPKKDRVRFVFSDIYIFNGVF
jgi:hypothetical protein